MFGICFYTQILIWEIKPKPFSEMELQIKAATKKSNWNFFDWIHGDYMQYLFSLRQKGKLSSSTLNHFSTLQSPHSKSVFIQFSTSRTDIPSSPSSLSLSLLLSHWRPVRDPPLQTSPLGLHQEEEHEWRFPSLRHRQEHHCQHGVHRWALPGSQGNPAAGGDVPPTRGNPGELCPEVCPSHWDWRGAGQEDWADESHRGAPAHHCEKG